MKPGRELDALIAEKVMKLRVEPCRSIMEPMVLANATGHFESYIPHYSTSIADAWSVVEKLIAEGGDVELICRDEGDPRRWWECHLRDFSIEKETVPHAICLAALKAMGVSDV